MASPYAEDDDESRLTILSVGVLLCLIGAVFLVGFQRGESLIFLMVGGCSIILALSE